MLIICSALFFFLYTVINVVVDRVQIADDLVKSRGVNAIIGRDLERYDGLPVEQIGAYLFHLQNFVILVLVLIPQFLVCVLVENYQRI